MVSESVEKILQTEASGEQKLEKAKRTADDILKKADKKIKEMEGKNLKRTEESRLQIEAETNKKLSDLETQIKKNREKAVSVVAGSIYRKQA